MLQYLHTVQCACVSADRAVVTRSWLRQEAAVIGTVTVCVCILTVNCKTLCNVKVHLKTKSVRFWKVVFVYSVAMARVQIHISDASQVTPWSEGYRAE